MGKAWVKSSKDAITGMKLQSLLAEKSTKPEDLRLKAIVEMADTAGCKRSVATKMVANPWLSPCAQWLNHQKLVLCSLILRETESGIIATLKIAAKEFAQEKDSPKTTVELGEQGHFHKHVPTRTGNQAAIERLNIFCRITQSHAAYLAGQKKQPVHPHTGRADNRDKSTPAQAKVIGFIDLSTRVAAAAHLQEHTPA